jgi:sugar lactone lactonase YvrE
MSIARLPKTHRLIDFALAVGESPVWDADNGVLWFIDIDGPLLFRLDPRGGTLSRFAMPSPVGSIGLASSGQILVALRSGIHLFDAESSEYAYLANPEPDCPMNRLNDGKVGPDGAFWVGSMHLTRPFQPTGALYRVTAAGECVRVISGLSVSNGLAWSPDGLTMYHADTPRGVVNAYQFCPDTGAMSQQRPLITLSLADGMPDGAAVDVEGGYWSAGVTAGCVNRISSDGVITDRYQLPVAFPTMPCFGGPDGKTLFITSLSAARDGVSDQGSLITIDVGIRGVPIPRFQVERPAAPTLRPDADV